MRRIRGLTALGALAGLAYVVHHARGQARQREPRAVSPGPEARFEPIAVTPEALAESPAGPDAMVAPMGDATSAAVASTHSNGSVAPTLPASSSAARVDPLGPIELPPKRRLSAPLLVTLAAIAAVAAIALAATAVASSRGSDDDPESIEAKATENTPAAQGPRLRLSVPYGV